MKICGYIDAIQNVCKNYVIILCSIVVISNKRKRIKHVWKFSCWMDVNKQLIKKTIFQSLAIAILSSTLKQANDWNQRIVDLRFGISAIINVLCNLFGLRFRKINVQMTLFRYLFFCDSAIMPFVDVCEGINFHLRCPYSDFRCSKNVQMEVSISTVTGSTTPKDSVTSLESSGLVLALGISMRFCLCRSRSVGLFIDFLLSEGVKKSKMAVASWVEQSLFANFLPKVSKFDGKCLCHFHFKALWKDLVQSVARLLYKYCRLSLRCEFKYRCGCWCEKAFSWLSNITVCRPIRWL